MTEFADHIEATHHAYLQERCSQTPAGVELGSAASGTCVTFRVLLKGLARLEMDMHENIHKENNVFVKASLAERRLREQ